MDAKFSRDLQFISLRVAATTAFIQLTGSAPNPRDFEGMERQLNDVARALAMVAPIHAMDPVTGLPVQIDEPLIGAGTFTRGGKVLKMPDGRAYQDLTIQRGECEAAISILRGARLPWRMTRIGTDPAA